MSSKISRITVSIPSDSISQLDYVARKLRCSRSALLGQILAESMPALQQIASCLPDPGKDVGPGDARRFRGESARVIGEQVAKLIEGAQDDFFSSK